MTRLIFIGLIGLQLAFVSCEKDPVIIEEQITSGNLADALSFVDTSKLNSNGFVCAGNHSSFLRNSPLLPIEILATIPAGAINIAIYTNDSLKFRDSLELYFKTNLSVEYDQDGLFTRFHLPETFGNRYARVYYEMNDSIFLSRGIAIRDTSWKTETISNIISDINSEDYLQFDWPNISATDQYLITMIDPSGDYILAFKTSRSSFPFYDLRFMDENLLPDLNRPVLSIGARYTFSIYSIAQSGWLNAFGSHTFIAE